MVPVLQAGCHSTELNPELRHCDLNPVCCIIPYIAALRLIYIHIPWWFARRYIPSVSGAYRAGRRYSGRLRICCAA